MPIGPRSRGWRRGGALLAAILSVTGLSNLSAVAQTSAPTPTSEDAAASAGIEERHAMELRAGVGLRSDLAHVRDLKNRSRELPSAAGLPMLPAEVSHMEQLERVSERAELVSAALSADDSSTFAAMWLAEGTLFVSSVEPIGDSRRRELTDLLPSGTTIRFVSARFTHEELQEVLHKLIVDRAYWEQHGMELGTFAVSSQANKIRVEVAGDGDVALAALEERYGQRGMFSVQGHVPRIGMQTLGARDFRSGPAYGGQWIRSNYDDRCSIGVSNAYSNSTGNAYTVTAGHCADDGVHWVMGLGLSPIIGQGRNNRYWRYLDTYCDCQIIGPLPSGFATSSRRVAYNKVEAFSATGRESVNGDTGSYYAGRLICTTGAESYEYYADSQLVCVQIENPAAYNIKDQHGHNHMNHVLTKPLLSRPLRSGDSGAPWAGGSVFLAITSGMDANKRGVLSKSYEFRDLNVSFRY